MGKEAEGKDKEMECTRHLLRTLTLGQMLAIIPKNYSCVSTD